MEEPILEKHEELPLVEEKLPWIDIEEPKKNEPSGFVGMMYQ